MSEVTYRSMREQVADLIRQEILTGNLQQGSAIREVALAKRLKVSRGPIRDAILQLSQEGVLETRPNRGARVGPVWDDELRSIMIGMRFELESFALWRVLENAASLDLSPFEQNLRKFEIACKDNELPEVVHLDLEFHRLILRLSGVRGIEAVWLPIMGGMRLPYSRHRFLLDSYHEHKEIVAGIKAGSQEQALAALKRNIH